MKPCYPLSLNHLNNLSQSQRNIRPNGTNLIIMARFSLRHGCVLIDNPTVEIYVCYLRKNKKEYAQVFLSRAVVNHVLHRHYLKRTLAEGFKSA